VEERRVRRERLCASVRERRSVARKAAVTSGEGGSPKMKNAPMRMTMESWPRRRPWVKERLVGCEVGHLELGILRTYVDSLLGRGTSGVAIWRDQCISAVIAWFRTVLQIRSC
jgi:hypothetical protein